MAEKPQFCTSATTTTAAVHCLACCSWNPLTYFSHSVIKDILIDVKYFLNKTSFIYESVVVFIFQIVFYLFQIFCSNIFFYCSSVQQVGESGFPYHIAHQSHYMWSGG